MNIIILYWKNNILELCFLSLQGRSYKRAHMNTPCFTGCWWEGGCLRRVGSVNCSCQSEETFLFLVLSHILINRHVPTVIALLPPISLTFSIFGNLAKFILSQIPLQSEKWHFGSGTSRMVKLMNGHQMSLIRLMCSPSLQLQLSPWDLTCWQPLFPCVCLFVHVCVHTRGAQRIIILKVCVDVALLLFIHNWMSWENGPTQHLHSNSAALSFWWGQLSAVGDSAVPVTLAPSRPSALPIWQPDTRRRHCTLKFTCKK